MRRSLDALNFACQAPPQPLFFARVQTCQMETISDRIRALRAHLGLNGDQFGAHRAKTRREAPLCRPKK